MIINSTNLRTLNVAFNAAFRGGFDGAPSQLDLIATTVPSTTLSNEYGWLGQFPNMREWLGDRVINSAQAFGYTDQEQGLRVDCRRAAPGDRGRSVRRLHADDDRDGPRLACTRISSASACWRPGPTTLCYDGQYFFDTDHPVLDANGVSQSQANWDNNAGAGTAWYLLDTSRALKPIIYQSRKPDNFVAKTNENDDNVFFQKEFVYGVDARRNVGFGFWQLAYGSRKTLDEANLTAALTAMTARTGDNGRPLGIRPTLLVVPPSLEVRGGEAGQRRVRRERRHQRAQRHRESDGRRRPG
jgi:phage major head subunit gpT-like protein